jgi:hypothetical protein
MHLRIILLTIFSPLFINKAVFAEKKLIKEYGFVILLEDQCTKKAELLNREIAAKLPGLENPANIWHITLHQGAYSETYLNEFKSNIMTLSLPTLNIYFDKIQVTDNKWINFNIKKNSDLNKLHGKIVKYSDRYFQRALIRAHDSYHDLSDKKKIQIDNHGTYGVLDDYRPHMTLFYHHPPSPKLEEAEKDMAKSIKPMKCKAEELAIAELEYNGNISKIVYSVKFP